MGLLINQLFNDFADGISGRDSPFEERYRNDPVGFAEDVLKVELWEKQKEILLSVRDHKYTMAWL